MNQSVFTTYVPAINAFLNARTDKVCKSWNDVVVWFFEMNNEKSFSSVSDIAALFINSVHPDFFRIPVDIIQPHFLKFTISPKSLKEKKFIENQHFISDDEGTRITFTTFRKLVIRHSDEILNESFEFIEKVFQIYSRYVQGMGNRSKRYTHWTIIERVDAFTRSMKPHASKQFHIMDVQPRVFCIIKGSLKTVNSTCAKYMKDPSKKYSTSQAFPIYETVLYDSNSEIDTLMGYLDQCHLRPYRENQIGLKDAEDVEITKISKTKCNMRLMQKCILIDPSQSEYTAEMLPGHIEEIRMKIKLGHQIDGAPVQRTSTIGIVNGNSVDIKIFQRTNGKHMDDMESLDLHPRNDDIALIYKSVEQYAPAIEAIDLEQEDDKSVASVMSDASLNARSRSCSQSSSKPRSSTLSSMDEGEEEGYSDDDHTKIAMRGRTNSSVSVKKVQSNLSEETKIEEEDEDGYSSSD